MWTYALPGPPGVLFGSKWITFKLRFRWTSIFPFTKTHKSIPMTTFQGCGVTRPKQKTTKLFKKFKCSNLRRVFIGEQVWRQKIFIDGPSDNWVIVCFACQPRIHLKVTHRLPASFSRVRKAGEEVRDGNWSPSLCCSVAKNVNTDERRWA